jgi:ribosomal protein S27AE
MTLLKFTCPHCGQSPPAEFGSDFVFTERRSCVQCGEEYVIVKNIPMKVLDYEKERTQKIPTR